MYTDKDLEPIVTGDLEASDPSPDHDVANMIYGRTPLRLSVEELWT